MVADGKLLIGMARSRSNGEHLRLANQAALGTAYQKVWQLRSLGYPSGTDASGFSAFWITSAMKAVKSCRRCVGIFPIACKT